MSAPLQRAGGKFLVPPNGLRHSLAILCRRQPRINALPESLGEGDSLGNRQRHSLARELLSGRGKKLASQETPAKQNVPDEVSLLAFGTKDYSAGDMPKVPKAWELSASVCSTIFCLVFLQEVEP